MIRKSRLSTSAQEPVPEARLWQAVLVSTIQDWVSGPLRFKQEAEQYLFSDNRDFRLVCESAGMDAERLRSRLGRLREQAIRDACALAAPGRRHTLTLRTA
jgi:hypothetical protein